MRNLVLVFGDQLSHGLSALRDFDKSADKVWMAEVDQEATKVWCHKTRLTLFFSAMRHFRDELRANDIEVDYHELTSRKSDDRGSDFETLLRKSVHKISPDRVIMTEPGDWFVRDAIERKCSELGVALEIRVDDHFYCSIVEFDAWQKNRKGLILENFYRWMRKRHNLLLDSDGEPEGGQWNFDKENRGTFGKSGPGETPHVISFHPDETTGAVIEMVNKRFADHPGTTEHFDYPVTAAEAKRSLTDFIKKRLPHFGDYQDAMWTDTSFLYHSRISAVMNMHMIDPAVAVNAAMDAYRSGHASLNSVEGFVRQIVGWREFVRGIYWTKMPQYIDRNSLACDDRDVPQSYWDGKTEMNCIKQSMQNVLDHSYAHHIQRLMVLGLYAQLLGVHPRKFHDWHMAMYADAIDWVSLPNTLGMSQHGDGAVVGTKPYCASGAYVNRMGNYCKSCRFDPKKSTGDEACPITTLYWDFLHRHRDDFKKNNRMVFQMKNLERKNPDELVQILDQADRVKREMDQI